ncbi:MAG: hypothetical protein MI922_23365 [Bacteroidales bacterium]|nr:hypothetical protein [Bacteroidales bacterium]
MSKNISKILILLAFISGSSVLGYSQMTIGIGGDVFVSNQFGAGVRAEIPLEQYGVEVMKGLSVVPQFTYGYLDGRSQHFLGSSVQLYLMEYKKVLGYGLANVSYNGGNPNNNVSADLGLGVTQKKCFRPFVEVKYKTPNHKLQVHFGAVYTFNCRIKGMVPCSKPPKPPKLN